MSGTERRNIRPGLRVRIVQKQHQKSGQLTEGEVKDILTNSQSHPHGIKVRLADGRIGRVREIIKG
ncbi:MAG: YwbE family protein [Nitrospirae bacterium]|nr:YwbE family protein [Nitrospirota bacterium]MCL5236922.1 YwbE family protein [Nitrospirota bacterium]